MDGTVLVSGACLQLPTGEFPFSLDLLTFCSESNINEFKAAGEKRLPIPSMYKWHFCPLYSLHVLTNSFG